MFHILLRGRGKGEGGKREGEDSPTDLRARQWPDNHTPWEQEGATAVTAMTMVTWACSLWPCDTYMWVGHYISLILPK